MHIFDFYLRYILTTISRFTDLELFVPLTSKILEY